MRFPVKVKCEVSSKGYGVGWGFYNGYVLLFSSRGYVVQFPINIIYKVTIRALGRVFMKGRDGISNKGIEHSSQGYRAGTD